ncbi:sodium channel protein Nach-like [Bradysia coprophila]|uniref:sodium channel protein Nach-like n=1 Tax=Bradysia coprophila TaxID=38358 RepID=UPI00187D979A|nr:sodium channel protein Nach-like [Bradysia coprophila]
MREVMHPCDNMLTQCLWLGQFVPCNTLFRTAKSIDGYCCSFNYDAIREDLEIDSDNVSEKLQNPNYRVSGAGPYVGMELLVNIEPEQYVSYTKTYFGVSVLIHSPHEYPQNSVAKTLGQIGTDVIINVVPSVIVSENSVQNLALAQRNCYFKDEVKLRTATRYSFSTCINECAVDTIFRMCGCVPFYYVEAQMIANATNIRQCTLQDVNCLRKNRHIFSSLQPDSALNVTVGLNCSTCKPSCSEVRYDIQTTVAQRLSEDQLRSLHFDDSVTLHDFVTLKIHFKDITCLKYRRDVFLTWDSMFASCGGIYSLCLGGSVISIIELIWFYTVKLYRFSNEPPKDNQPKISSTRQNETMKLSMKHGHDRAMKKPKIRQIEEVSK